MRYTTSEFVNSGRAKRSNLSALSVLTCLFLTASGANAYTEPGVAGNTQSWETPEYYGGPSSDWGLKSMNASTAYALGFTGKGVTLGIVDSGMPINHSEFSDGRIKAIRATGTFYSDGVLYPDAEFGDAPFAGPNTYEHDLTNRGEYKKGEAFDVDGVWIAGLNDGHGAHVGGTIAAARNGEGMHGVAFEANLFSANTGANDTASYGPSRDYNYFLKAYGGLADAGARVINSSWGSDTRLDSAYESAIENANGIIIPDDWSSWSDTSTMLKINNYSARHGYDVYLWDRDQTKFEFNSNKPEAFLFIDSLDAAKKSYYQFATLGHKTYLDAVAEVTLNKGVIQVFTAGNVRYMANPSTRAMLPYFKPELEKYWVNVTVQGGSYNNVYPSGAWSSAADVQYMSQPGYAKWWSIAAPGDWINSVDVCTDNDYRCAGYGDIIYRARSGTSMAAPHVTGALGVIMQRYPYMTNPQAREVMLTTARTTTLRTGIEGTPLERWSAPAGTPDPVWGWGILDLGKAMFGPGQFLGNFDVTMDVDDEWANDISDVAIKYRKTEDEADAAAWTARKAVLEAKSNLTAEEKAELEFEMAREKARNERAAQGYAGSLIKNGSGTLTLAGTNSYTGDTVINGGKIVAVNQALSASNVIVNNGGSLEIAEQVGVKKLHASGNIVESYVTSDPSKPVNAEIRSGGTLVLPFEGGAKNLNVTFRENALIDVPNSLNDISGVWSGADTSATYFAEGVFTDYAKANLVDYAFFNTSSNLTANKLELSLSKKEGGMASVARTHNESVIAKAIESSANLPATFTAYRSAGDRVLTSDLYNSLIFATTKQAQDTLSTLANESNFVAQNSSVINNLLFKNAMTDYEHSANNIAQENGVTYWLGLTANRLSYSGSDVDTKTYGQMFGINGKVNDSFTIGAVLGRDRATTELNSNTEYKNTSTRIGLYANTNLSVFDINIGAIYADSHRKKKGPATIAAYTVQEDIKTNEKITTLFADVGLNNLTFGAFSIKPYVGYTYMNAKVDGYSQEVGPHTITADKDNRDLSVATIGINPSATFNALSKEFIVSANVAYNRFFGQKSPELAISLADAAIVGLKGKEIKDIASVDFGIEAKLTSQASLKLSYTGMFGDNLTSNGAMAKFSFAF